MFTAYYASPIGQIEITASETAIVSLYFSESEKPYAANRPATESNDVLKQCMNELELYFQGKLTDFTVKMDAKGTDFQQRVWSELQNINYATTISYAQLAARLGDPKVIRAAGTANGKNPISIIVPCHRVIGADGSLTGYAGDLWRKQWLLEHENPNLKKATLF